MLYRLRAAGVCVRRNAVNGQLEMLLVSAQRGLNCMFECTANMFNLMHIILAWVIPGGGIEIGEEMHEAVLREVEEEAGVRAIVTELIGEFQVRFVKFIQKAFTYLRQNRGTNKITDVTRI